MHIYEVTRIDGTVTKILGADNWELLLTHDDVVQPGRIACFRVLGAKSPVQIDLDASDVLVFKRRTRLLQHFDGSETPLGTRTIVGKQFPNGSGSYFIIYSNDTVLWTPDPNAQDKRLSIGA